MNLLSLGQPKTVAKGSYLLRAGEHCNGLFYIKEGLARVFYLKDGKEITDWFAGSGTFLTAMDSFHSEKVSDQYIEALSDLAFVYIERKAIKEAYESQPGLKDEYLSIVSQHLIRLQERVKALQFYTAKERYQLLAEKNPQALKLAPRTHIASYLGISLETLSRIRL